MANLSRGVWSVLLVSFLDMVAVGLVVPLLGGKTKELGASPFVSGAIASTYGALQLITGPASGHLSDLFGRVPLLVGCLFGTALAYLVTGTADTLFVLVLGRVLAGTFKQTTDVAKAFLTDLTTSDDRVRVMSYFYTASGLGFMIGPAVGGLLGNYWAVLPFLLSSAIYVANGVFVIVKLSSFEETIQVTNKLAATESANKQQHSFLQVLQSLNPLLRRLLVFRLLTGLAVTLMRSSFFLLLEYPFQIDAATKGLAMSYFAVVGVASQALVVPFVTRILSERAAVVAGSGLIAASLLLVAVASTVSWLCVAITLLGVATSVTKTTMTGLFTKAAPPEMLGGVLGVVGAAFSLCRAIAPLLSGWLIQEMGTTTPCIVAAVLSGTCCALALVSDFEVPRDARDKAHVE